MFSRRHPDLYLALLLAFLIVVGSAGAYSAWAGIASSSDILPLASGADHSRAVLLLIPGLSDAIFRGEDRSASLLDGFSAALVNVRTGGGRVGVDAAATISAGARAYGVPDLIVAAADDPVMHEPRIAAAEVFSAWYGVQLPVEGGAVIDFPRLAEAQGRLDHPVRLGALGGAFRRAGLKTAFVDASFSEGAGILSAADETGVVDLLYGRDESSVPDAASAAGRRTEWGLIAQHYQHLPADVGLMVLEAGDLNAPSSWMPSALIQESTHQFLSDLTSFARSLAHRDDMPTVLILDHLPDGEGMGLVLAPQGTGAHLLTSPTTRRPGVVSLQDVAATLLRAAGISSEPGFGRPIGVSTVQAENPLADLARLRSAVAEAQFLRAPLAQVMSALVVIISVILLVTLLWAPNWFSVAGRCFAAVSLLPLAAVMAPGVVEASSMSLMSGQVLMWVSLIAVAACLHAAWGLRRTVVILSSATVIMILADQLGGARWALLSPLGYSVVAGARYYGLGNEFLGILLGALVLVWVLESRPSPRGTIDASALFRGSLLLAASAIVAGPRWGANFGGGLVFAMWLGGTAAISLMGRPPLKTVRWAPAGTVLAGVFALGIVLWHGVFPRTDASHVGVLVMEGTGDAFTEVFWRKIMTGIRLFRYTVWTRVWIFILGLFAVISFRPFGSMRRLFESSPELGTVSRLALGLSIAALITNDSGVVTAALTVMGPVAVALMALEKEVPPVEANGEEKRYSEERCT